MDHFKEVLNRPDPEITPDIREAEADLAKNTNQGKTRHGINSVK